MALVGSGNIRPAIWSPKGQQAEHPNKGYKSVRFKPGLTSSPTDFNEDGVPTVKSTSGEATIGRSPQNTDYPPFPVPNIIVSDSSENSAPSAADRVWRPKTPDQFQDRQQPGNFPVNKFSSQSHTDGIKRPGSAGNQSIYDTPRMNAGINQNKINQNQPNFQASQFDGNKNFSNTNQNFQTSRLPIGSNSLQREGPNFTNQQGFNRGQQFQQHVNNQQPQQMQQFSNQQQQQFNKLPQQQNFNNQSQQQFSQQPQQQNFHNQSQQQFNQQPHQLSFNNQSQQQNFVQNNGLHHQQNFNHQQHNAPHQLPNSNQQPFYNLQNQQKQTFMQHGQAGQMQHQQPHPLPQQQHQQQNLMHQQQQYQQQQQHNHQQQYQQDEADNEASEPFQMAKLQAKFEKFQSGKTETNRPSSAGKQNLFQNGNRLALDKPSTQSHEISDVRNGQEGPVAGQVTMTQEVKSTARWNPVRSVVDSPSEVGQGKVKLGRPPDSHQDEKLQSEEWWNAFMQDPNQIQPPQVDMERVITSATRQQNIISPGSHGSPRQGGGERKGEVLQEWRSGLYDDRPSGRSSVDLYEQLKNTYKHSNSPGGRGPGVKRQISEPFPRGSFPDHGESFRIDQITSKSTQPGRALPPVVKPDSIQRNPVKLEAIVREEPEQKNGSGTLNRPSFSRGISEPAPSLTGPTRSGPLTDPSRSGQTMPAILSPNSTLRNETIRTQNKFNQPDEGRSVGPNISWNRAEVGTVQNESLGQSGPQRNQGPTGGGTGEWNQGKVNQNWPGDENMFEGIGPMDTLTGIPLLPGNSIQDRSKREWYKKMYDAIHKSEPTQDDLDREASPLMWDLKHDSNKSNSLNQPQPRPSTQQYRNQPMRIEDYQPGHSSLTLQNDKRKAAVRSRNVYTNGRRHVHAESDTEANYGRDYPTDLLLSPTYSDTGDVNRFQKYGRAKGSRYATINTDKVSRQMTPDDFKQKRRDEIDRVIDEERLRRFKEEQKMNQSRRHTDTLTPMQKSSIMLNRFDEDFQDNLERPLMKCPTRIRGKAKALYTFRAQNNRELSFKRGDPIYILKQIDKNWLKGELHGVEGIFPANYVEVTVSLDDARSAALEKEGQAVVNYNFAAQSPAELSLRKGDVVQLIKRIDENWYEGRVGNRQGIFPVSYVECNREPNTPLMTPMSSHAPTPLPGTPGRLSPTSTNSVVGPDVPSAPISPWAWDTDFYESEFETGNSRARTPVNVDVGLSSTSDHSGNSPQPFKDQKIYTSGPDQPLLTVSGPPQSRFAPSSDQRGASRPDLNRSQSLTNPPKNLTSLPDDTMSLDDLEDFLKSLAQDRSVTPIHVDTNPAPESDVRANLAARVVDHKPPIRPSTLQAGRELKKGTGSSGSSPGTLSGRPPSGVRSEKKMQLGGPSGEGKGSGRSTPTPKEIGSFIRATNDAQFLFSKPTNGINYPRYRALYDYNPTNQDELELRIGEVVNVMEKCDDGWYVGVSEKTNKFGTFPGNYVRPIW